MKKTSEWFFWDWKSIRRTVFVFIILLLGIALVLFYPDWIRKIDSNNYTENTVAFIIDVRLNETISMSEIGNETIVNSYKVRYTYKIKNVQYKSIDIIPNSIENKKLISQICRSKNENVKIKYDPKKPEKSIIIK
jgi:uncharacterized protein YebE (UPF0316 family)